MATECFPTRAVRPCSAAEGSLPGHGLRRRRQAPTLLMIWPAAGWLYCTDGRNRALVSQSLVADDQPACCCHAVISVGGIFSLAGSLDTLLDRSTYARPHPKSRRKTCWASVSPRCRRFVPLSTLYAPQPRVVRKSLRSIALPSLPVLFFAVGTC